MGKKFWYVAGGFALGAVIMYNAVAHDWCGKLKKMWQSSSDVVVEHVDNGYHAAKEALQKDIGELITEFRGDMKERESQYPQYAGQIAQLGVDSIGVANSVNEPVGQEAIRSAVHQYATIQTRKDLAIETIVNSYAPKVEDSYSTPALETISTSTTLEPVQ